MIQKIKSVVLQGGFLRYLKNTSWLMGEKVARMLVALTVGVWVARYLGPNQFGILSYAQSFVGLFTAFSTLGLNDIIIRELIKNKQDKNSILGTSFWLQIMGSCFIMLCLLIAVFINKNDELTNKIILILGGVTFINSFGVISSYFYSNVTSKNIVIPSFIGLLLSAAFKIFFILNNYSLIYFVYVLVFDVFFLMMGQVYLYYQQGNTIVTWSFSWDKAKNLLLDAWPLILSAIVISIYMKIDQVMIKEFLNAEAVGQYSAAVRLSEAWYFIPMIICSSLFPAILNAKKVNEQLYLSRLQNLFNLMVVLGLVVVVPVLLLSDWGIALLYGKAYELSAAVLKIHIWAGVFVFLGVANQKWFISENLQKYNILCLALGMLTNVLLNIVFIPKYGVLGAAYATLLAQAIASLVAPVLFKKTRVTFYMMVKALFFIPLIKKSIKRS
ncbi:flippase [Cellulophaga omnivescoria]|uniref:flippase n=1 Tax=Cellulophaga omnivescoria TaxID=1888890 RepID=UPI0022F01249|nr:flippase [Cellulophaga omnivescoria]WBU88804.1 flippase [Cellulophaga omnivescoria]